MRRIASIVLAAPMMSALIGAAEDLLATKARHGGIDKVEVVATPTPIVIDEPPPVEFPGKPDPVFSQLPEDSWIDVKFESEGCFESGKWRFRFAGGKPPRVTISGASNSVDEPSPRELLLSDSDMRGLDMLLSYYRSPPQVECTTKDTVEFQWRSEGQRSQEGNVETFVDETCGAGRYNNILWLRDLIRRAREEDAA